MVVSMNADQPADLRAFTKTGKPGEPEYEAKGLAWLKAGGAKVPAVLHVGTRTLKTEWLPSAAPNEPAAEEMGRMLAHMHAAGAPHFGSPPTGYSGAGSMGRAPMELLQKDPGPWGPFYAKYRILPYLTNVFGEDEKLVIYQLADALEEGRLDFPQPALVQKNGHKAARIHGDLWAGNIMWTPEAYLIDPAAEGGHAEEDFGALATFGAPYFDAIARGYEQVSPMSEGWRTRIPLRQMHILIVHCYLFGRSYVPRTLSAARAALEVAN